MGKLDSNCFVEQKDLGAPSWKWHLERTDTPMCIPRLWRLPHVHLLTHCAFSSETGWELGRLATHPECPSHLEMEW